MIWKGIGRNQGHRRLLELNTSLQRLGTSTGLHDSCWRGSACTARAAVAHIWPPRSSDTWPPSYTPTFCSSNKFLSSQRIPGAQMTNTSEWPRASSNGESLVFFLRSKTLTCYPSNREQVWDLLTQGGLPQLNMSQQAHKMGQSTLNTLLFQPISITARFGEGKKEEKRKERRSRCSPQLWPLLPKSGFKFCCFGNNSSKTPSLLPFRST